jgi:predicted small secreted protein
MKNAFKWVGMATITLAAMSVTACNTVQGAGKDIESAGKKIEEVAK